MVGKCANGSCSASQNNGDGKLFRLDLDIGNTAGTTQRKTAYIWLCGRCAPQMNPRVEVAGSTVRVLLAMVHHPLPIAPSSAATVN
jgi:hypothetical protein